MKTKFIISTVVASLLLSSTALFAGSYHDSVTSKEAKALQNESNVKGQRAAQAKIEEVNDREAFLAKVKSGDFKKEASKEETQRLNTTLNDAMQKHKQHLKKSPKEFMQGLNNTILALKAIDENKTKEATDLLKKADKDLTTAFKKEPKLGLIPVNDSAKIITFNGDAKLIKHIKEAAIKLLQDNNTQLAIDMLMPLQDEMIITTQLIPSYIYPKAIKESIKALKDGKKEIAKDTLLTALNATQIDTIIIPIPLITAQNMILEASKLQKTHKKEALKLLNAAQDELQKAILLGYANNYQKEYKALDKKIEDIKTEINGKNMVVKLYENLLKSFKDLGSKH